MPYEPPGDVPPLPLEVLTFAQLRDMDRAGRRRRPQRPRFHVFAFVDGGEGTHRVDFIDARLTARSVVHIRPGAVHQWSDVDDVEGTLLLATPGAVVGELAARPPQQSTRRAASETWALIGAALEHLRGEYEAAVAGPGPSSDAILRHCLAALALRALADADGRDAPGAASSTFLRYQEAVEQHFRRWHVVADYAAELRFSARTLTRAVRAAAGVSAKQLLDERVVLEAKRLLAHSDLAVAEIAEELGFSEPSNFSAFFSRFAGAPPGRWRHRELLGLAVPGPFSPPPGSDDA